MNPGLGFMKRRLEKEQDAISLAISGIVKKYDTTPEKVTILETKYHDDSGDWYVALGWNGKNFVVQMDSVQGTILDIMTVTKSYNSNN